MTDRKPQLEYIIITLKEFNEIMDILQYWTTGFRNGCTEKDRLWLQRIINMVGEIRSRPTPSHSECYKTGYVEGAAQARNATLELVEVKLNEIKQVDDNLQYYLWLEDVESVIESLRGEP